MRGHIVKRYKDSYTIVLNLGKNPSTGRRKQQWVSVKGTKKDAEKRLGELIHQLDTGTFMRPGKTTLAVFLEKWLNDYARPNLSPRTTEGYESIIQQHIIPKLGSITLTQLKPEHIQQYYSEAMANGRCNGRGGLTPHTVRHHHMALHRALEVAVKWGLLNRNPVDMIDPPRFQRVEMNVMNEDDINNFLETARPTRYYALFYLALFTGMRRSELLALRWSDIDLYLCQVSVNRTLHRLRDGSLIFQTPKTAKGRRTVALTPSASIMMREYKEKQEADKKVVGIHLEESNFVFSDVEDRPMLPDTISRAWAKLASKAGLKGIRLHDARHTHASIMLKQGIHPKIVQERLGHASIQVTLDTYSHVAPGMQQKAAESFDNAVISVRSKEAIGSGG